MVRDIVEAEGCRATMAAILPVVSKRMVILFEGTVKIVILTAICRLVTPERRNIIALSLATSNHIFGCGVTWRGEVRA